MRLDTHLVLALVALTWSIAVLLSVATALLARNPKQREDARKVLTSLLRSRPSGDG